MRCDGKTAPRKLWRVIDRLRFGLRDRLTEEVTVVDGERSYRFACTNRFEVWRAATMMVKEEGTIEWLRGEVRPDDVVYDIGANIGLYSIFAGARLGGSGRVYAFEPHAMNFAHLCRNIMANGLGETVTPVSVALSDGPTFSAFHYLQWDAASSFSQFGDVAEDFATKFVELKYGCALDEMLAEGALPPPTLVKIDVDGNEPKILRGMKGLLEGPERPRSVQVEIQKGGSDGIVALMQSMTYELAHRHFTISGKKKLARGLSRDDVAHNAVFVPA